MLLSQQNQPPDELVLGTQNRGILLGLRSGSDGEEGMLVNGGGVQSRRTGEEWSAKVHAADAGELDPLTSP